MKLDEARAQLSKTTQEIFKLIEFRKEIVTKIFKIKSDSFLSPWDPEQEIKVFSRILKNQKMTLNLALIYSLMIEDHACSLEENYPKWSELEHLESKVSVTYAMINPILLMMLNRPLYNSLTFNKNIKKILQKYEHSNFETS